MLFGTKNKFHEDCFGHEPLPVFLLHLAGYWSNATAGVQPSATGTQNTRRLGFASSERGSFYGGGENIDKWEV